MFFVFTSMCTMVYIEVVLNIWGTTRLYYDALSTKVDLYSLFTYNLNMKSVREFPVKSKPYFTTNELKELREILGYTLEEIEIHSKGKIVASTLHSYEIGTRNPPTEKSIEIAWIYYHLEINRYIPMRVRDTAKFKRKHKRFYQIITTRLERINRPSKFMLVSINRYLTRNTLQRSLKGGEN